MHLTDEEINSNGRCGGLKRWVPRMGNMVGPVVLNKLVMWFCGLTVWSSHVGGFFFWWTISQAQNKSTHTHTHWKKHRFAVLRGLVAFYQAASHGKHHSVIPCWLLDWRLCCDKSWSRLMLVRCWEHVKPAFCGTSSSSRSEWRFKNPWPLTWYRVAITQRHWLQG